MELLNTIWSFIARLDVAIGIIAAIFAVRAWLQSTRLLKANRLAAQRREAGIRIMLQRNDSAVGEDNNELELPYRPRRDQLSRAELTGILGLYYGQPRFDATILLPILHDGTLNRVLAGTDASSLDETLRIPCSSTVFDRIKSGIQRQQSAPESTPAESSPSTGQPTGPGTGKYYGIEVVRDSKSHVLLKVGFHEPASNELLVPAAIGELKAQQLEGGPLLLIDGKMSLPIAMAMAHQLAHLFEVVACRDPKLGKFVVAISHSPDTRPGTLLDTPE